MRRQQAEGGGNAQRGPRDERDDQQRRRPHRLVPERERDIVITTRPQLLPVRVRNKLTAAATPPWPAARATPRSEEHTSELQSLMRIYDADFSLKTNND